VRCPPISTNGYINRRIVLQADMGIKRDPISIITTAKRAGYVTQVVQHLPSKGEALSLILSTEKTKRILESILGLIFLCHYTEAKLQDG
jgi:hypothetical protein